MTRIAHLASGIRAFRQYLPAGDYATSFRFCEAIGFDTSVIDASLAELTLGAHAFLLQDFYVAAWAENMMMHVLVDDVTAWWQHIDALDLAGRFGVKASSAPRLQPWRLTTTYVFDPSGVLWHFAQPTPTVELT